jgi:hypothetical protein
MWCSPFPVLVQPGAERRGWVERLVVETSEDRHAGAVAKVTACSRHQRATPSRCADIAFQAPTGSCAAIRSSTASCWLSVLGVGAGARDSRAGCRSLVGGGTAGVLQRRADLRSLPDEPAGVAEEAQNAGIDSRPVWVGVWNRAASLTADSSNELPDRRMPQIAGCHRLNRIGPAHAKVRERHPSSDTEPPRTSAPPEMNPRLP